MENSELLVWHFANNDGKLGYKDGRTIILGEMLKVEGEIIPCKFGLHGSAFAFDALNYAQGTLLSRCKLSGTIVPHGNPIDKYAASERTAIAGPIDATQMLRTFAFYCAEDARQEAVKALKNVKLDEAAQKLAECEPITDESAAASASSAAWSAESAAWSARSAESAARNAAWSAAWSARSAVVSAASARARDAASAARAARGAAESAARGAAESARGAAWSARGAAWGARGVAVSAAWSARSGAAVSERLRLHFEKMCCQLLEIEGES